MEVTSELPAQSVIPRFLELKDCSGGADDGQCLDEVVGRRGIQTRALPRGGRKERKTPAVSGPEVDGQVAVP